MTSIMIIGKHLIEFWLCMYVKLEETLKIPLRFWFLHSVYWKNLSEIIFHSQKGPETKTWQLQIYICTSKSYNIPEEVVLIMI